MQHLRPIEPSHLSEENEEGERGKGRGKGKEAKKRKGKEGKEKRKVVSTVPPTERAPLSPTVTGAPYSDTNVPKKNRTHFIFDSGYGGEVNGVRTKKTEMGRTRCSGQVRREGGKEGGGRRGRRKWMDKQREVEKVKGNARRSEAEGRRGSGYDTTSATDQ